MVAERTDAMAAGAGERDRVMEIHVINMDICPDVLWTKGHIAQGVGMKRG